MIGTAMLWLWLFGCDVTSYANLPDAEGSGLDTTSDDSDSAADDDDTDSA